MTKVLGVSACVGLDRDRRLLAVDFEDWGDATHCDRTSSTLAMFS